MTELLTNSNLTLNMTTNMTQPTPEFRRSFTVTATVFFAAIFLLGVLGNMLVISVVCFNKNMKSSVNMYLLNLCVADILVLTICMPTTLADIYTKTAWHFGGVMCKLVPYLEHTVAHGSILTILAISIERYRVVCHPLKGVNENYKKVWKVVAVIWIISAVASLPWISLPVYKNSFYKDGTPFKACKTYISEPWHKAYIVLLTVVFFVLPSSALLFLYCIVCYVLHKARQETTRLGKTNQYRDKKRLRRQVINILTSIVLLFFICHLPYRVFGIWTTFGRDLEKLGFETYFDILYACRIMFYLNHAINPIIYNFVSSKFRNALRYMLTGQARSGSLVSSHQQRQVNDKYRYTNTLQQGQSHTLTGDKDAKPKERNWNTAGTITPESSSPCSPSGRRKRNEFFPMYANIIEENVSKDNADSEKCSDDHDNKCELQIRLVDKDVDMCINYRNSKRKRFVKNNCCRMV